MSSDPSTTDSAEAPAPAKPFSRIALAVASLTVVTLLVLGILVSVGAASTVACSRCHAPQAAALADSPHSGIACERCHFASHGPVSSRIAVVTRMLPSSVGGVRLEGPGRPMGRGVCVSCHPKWVAGGVVSNDGLRINHTRCTVGASCESCHGETIHGTATRLVRKAAMADCVACHVEKSAPLDCATCHVGKVPTAGTGDPEFARTHGPDWKTMHGTGDLRSCAGCHAPDSCRRCHRAGYPHPANFGVTHGPEAVSVGRDACLTCHKNAAFCTGCHGIEMPHPAGFLQRHGTIATSVNDPQCAICHVLADCAQCHDYHVHPAGPGLPGTGVGGQ